MKESLAFMPKHNVKSKLFTIATPKITITVPWRMRKMLLVPISVHHIPSAGKAAAFSSAGTAADDQDPLPS